MARRCSPIRAARPERGLPIAHRQAEQQALGREKERRRLAAAEG
jgi:hypothetical protein